jgi:hypothetical protein
LSAAWCVGNGVGGVEPLWTRGGANNKAMPPSLEQIGLPNNPGCLELFDTRVQWVGKVGNYTRICVLGIGSSGRPNKTCILNCRCGTISYMFLPHLQKGLAACKNNNKWWHKHNPVR